MNTAAGARQALETVFREERSQILAVLIRLTRDFSLAEDALQEAFAALHAEAPRAALTDWPQIAALYTLLLRLQPSPVVELNRAVAIGMAAGPAAGLALIDGIAARGRAGGLPPSRGGPGRAAGAGRSPRGGGAQLPSGDGAVRQPRGAGASGPPAGGARRVTGCP